MRQYDPTINSVLGREDLETYNTFFEENDLRVLLERKDYHSILKWAQLAYYKELVSAEMFREAASAEKVDYVIVKSDDLDAVQFYQSWGCSVLGEVDGYCVLRTEID